MKQVNVQKLLKSENGSSAEVRLFHHRIQTEDEDTDNQPEAIGLITLTKDQATIQAEGEIQISQTLACDKCLEETKVEWSAQLEQAYAQNPEKENIKQIRNDTINLDTAISEAAASYRPLLIHCRENCKGLCDTCGINLNENPEHSH